MIEEVGAKFSLKKLESAQSLAKKIVQEVSLQVFEGMSEDDGIQLVDKAYEKYNITKKWHPTKFRIGINTVCAFREKSSPVQLKKGDYYFIDIGPVIDGHEGDFGETFRFQSKDDLLLVDSKKIFDLVKNKFYEQKLSGEQLYEYAESCAQEMNYTLVSAQKGHRIGDFPHALYFKKGLRDYNDIPVPNRWVLEVHIIHSSNKYGAFYEDIISNQ